MLYSSDSLKLPGAYVWTERHIQLRVVSVAVNRGKVHLDDIKQCLLPVRSEFAGFVLSSVVFLFYHQGLNLSDILLFKTNFEAWNMVLFSSIILNGLS